jgi:hypothetical protein
MTDQRADETDEPGASGGGTPISGRVITIVLLVAVVVAGIAGWLWLDVNAVRPLPGTPLSIQSDPPPPSGFVCGTQLIPPARLVVRGGTLVLVASDGGADIPAVWPAGYAARLDQGRGGLYNPTGYLVAAEGQNIQERFYGSPGADGAFHVCRVTRD